MSFDAICGHEKNIALLQGAIRENRISHAYLFYGIEGVGKKTTARIFAKALNCVQGGPEPCDRCPSCLKMDRGYHLDFVSIAPEGPFIRIRQIRDLQDQMRFSPVEGRTRVFLLCSADQLKNEAANALLKTLEEPSRNNVLILVSSRPHQLPQTILSRCQRVRFNPVAKEAVASFLETMFAIDRQCAVLLAASSAGSIGRALEMNKEDYVQFKNGVIDRFAELKDLLDFFSFLEDFGADRESIMKRLDILQTWYRDILVYQVSAETEKLIHRDRVDKIASLAGAMSGSRILENIKTVTMTRRAIEQNANRQLALDCMAFRLFR